MSTPVHFHKAQKNDVAAIVGMLADDPLGAKREHFETPLPQSYFDAFEAIDSDSNHELVLATVDGEIAGVLQLTVDKSRPDTLRFYQSLGFIASHEGMKLHF